MSKKEDILRHAGYRYNFDRLAYVNSAARKIFSVDYVNDHSEESLVEKIGEVGDSDEWQVYTNERLSPRVYRDLVAVLDGQHANR